MVVFTEIIVICLRVALGYLSGYEVTLMIVGSGFKEAAVSAGGDW